MHVLLINGAFGVGKTSVARALCSLLPRAARYDPELAGIALRAISRVLPLAGAGSEDFQDLASWRRSLGLGVRAVALGLRPQTVIVPMTFDNPDYFDEVMRDLRAFDPAARAFCLTAPLPVIRERLRLRGSDPEEPWLERRVPACVLAHQTDRFGRRIATEGRSVMDVAREILCSSDSP